MAEKKRVSGSGSKLLVNRKIELKSVMTDFFRDESKKEFQRQIKQIEAGMTQLQELVRTQLGDNPSERQSVESELKKLASQRQFLNDKLQALINTKNGDLFSFNIIDGQTSLNPGDDVREKLGIVEVVTQDFKVLTIKNRDGLASANG